MSEATRVLFVEDEAPFRLFAGEYLEENGFQVTHAGSAAEALAAPGDPQVVLLDLNLPDLHGLEVLRRLRARDPSLRVVVLTSYGDAQNAVAALKAGATDYLTKPIELDRLLEATRAALASPSAEGAREAAAQEEPAAPPPPRRSAAAPGEGAPAELLGQHPTWLAALERLDRVIESQLPTLLLLGESGTGKTALARRFHTRGPRRERPFVSVDCPSIPEALLESELFGHERGAFTGATATKRGQVELAEGGVLFLDEIGELPLAMQPKLLRFIETRRFRRVGGLEERRADVLLVCATNRDLRQEVTAGAFRRDLFFRLEVAAIELPPLRERGEDALLLAEAFCNPSGAAGAPRLTPAARAALREHPFPGNARELYNLIQRALAFRRGEELDAQDLELTSARREDALGEATPSSLEVAHPVDLDVVLQALEADYVDQAVSRCDSQREAAGLLGLNRFALGRRLNRMARGGGVEAARAVLAGVPPWLRGLLDDLPRELPSAGLDVSETLRHLEQRAIAHALRFTEGNRSRAATLLGLSRPTLIRRLQGQG